MHSTLHCVCVRGSQWGEILADIEGMCLWHTGLQTTCTSHGQVQPFRGHQSGLGAIATLPSQFSPPLEKAHIRRFESERESHSSDGEVEQ